MTRILFEPMDMGEGRWHTPEDTVEEPERVHLEPGWVLVRRDEQFGDELVRAYPSSQVTMVEFRPRVLDGA